MAGRLLQPVTVQEPQSSNGGFEPTSDFLPAVHLGGYVESLRTAELDAGNYDYDEKVLRFVLQASEYSKRIKAGWQIGHDGDFYNVDQVDNTNRFKVVLIGKAPQ